MKLNTVNVIEYVNDAPLSLHAFGENEKGNQEAETLFTKLIREHNKDGGPKFSDDDIDAMISDGIYDDDCGYQLFLTHSS